MSLLRGRRNVPIVLGALLGLAAAASGVARGQMAPAPEAAFPGRGISPQGAPSVRGEWVFPSPQGTPGGCPHRGHAGEMVMTSHGVRPLLGMSGPELDDLYRRSAAGPIPTGKVRGTAIFRPGSRLT